LERKEWEIAWSDFLSVGIPEMDDEHRQFVARVNELNKAVIDSEDKAEVLRALQRMLNEAKLHFEHEEQLLEKWKYPEIDAHIVLHEELREQFERAAQEIASEDISFVWALKTLRLKQLLVEHLVREDSKYRAFLQARRG